MYIHTYIFILIVCTITKPVEMRSDSCPIVGHTEYETQISKQYLFFPSFIPGVRYEKQKQHHLSLQWEPYSLTRSLATWRHIFWFYDMNIHKYSNVLLHIFISKISVQFPVKFQYCATHVIAYNSKSCTFVIPLIPTYWIYNCQETTMPSYFIFSKKILFYCGFHSFPDVLPSLKETSLGDARLRWNIIIATY